MKICRGNLWTYKADWRIIPTNGVIKKNGEAVMGAGLALQAKIRFPSLPKRLAAKIEQLGNHVAIFEDIKIITFPTKNNWKDKSLLRLIEQSCIEIASLPYNDTFAIPRVGCGLGGLRWEDVEPILKERLDNRFIVLI